MTPHLVDRYKRYITFALLNRNILFYLFVNRNLLTFLRRSFVLFLYSVRMSHCYFMEEKDFSIKFLFEEPPSRSNTVVRSFSFIKKEKEDNAKKNLRKTWSVILFVKDLFFFLFLREKRRLFLVHAMPSAFPSLSPVVPVTGTNG